MTSNSEINTHEIPASTILALTQAKANGHRVYIATGRPPIIITNLGAIEHLIDGRRESYLPSDACREESR